MGDTDHRFFECYLTEGLLLEPKRMFVAVADLFPAPAPPSGAILDIGCANGSFLHYVGNRLPGWNRVGIDLFDEMIHAARTLVPGAQFEVADALALPTEFAGRFDLVTALAVVHLVAENDLDRFFDNVLGCLKPGGRAYVMAPMNEYGCDVAVTSRNRRGPNPDTWLREPTVYAHETIQAALNGKCSSVRIIPFDLGMARERQSDPHRTWTMRTEKSDYQLMNGLKLLVDQFIIEIHL